MGESLSLQKVATDLTFDVIGKVALDIDMVRAALSGYLMRMNVSLIADGPCIS